jgi:hypothetical protein
MADVKLSSESGPPLWPSLVIASVFAIAIPVVNYFVSDPVGLTLIFLPIYIPLAFAFIWPIIVAFQGTVSGQWLRRHTVALVLFLTATGASALWMEIGRRHARNVAAEERQRQQNLQSAQDILSTKGLFAFAEPLKPGEIDALTRYLHGHPEMAAGDLLRLSERYQDPGLMHELVGLRFCPPDALQIIFTKTVKNNEMPMSGPTHWAVEDTFLQIARRADTPPEVLGKLLNVTKSPDVRLAALKNPRVARSEKVAYEKTLCIKPMPGAHYLEEFQFAAADADAPLQLLQCLAADRPDIEPSIRRAAQENIQKRATAQ